MANTRDDAQSDSVERARKGAVAAQRSAAESLRKSAESQDRIANMYQDRAESASFHDDDVDHAARHRNFAREDRMMSERARRSVEEHLEGDSGRKS